MLFCFHASLFILSLLGERGELAMWYQYVLISNDASINWGMRADGNHGTVQRWDVPKLGFVMVKDWCFIEANYMFTLLLYYKIVKWSNNGHG